MSGPVQDEAPGKGGQLGDKRWISGFELAGRTLKVIENWVGLIEGRARSVSAKGSKACCLSNRGPGQWISNGRRRRGRGAVSGSEVQLREYPAKGLMELHKRSNYTIHP